MQKGTIITDPKNKKMWRLRWNDKERLPDGTIKPIKPGWSLPKAFYPTKNDAQRWLNENHLNELNKKHHQPIENPKFSALAQRWEKTILIHKKASTQDTTPWAIGKLNEVFGDRLMTVINLDLIQDQVNAWKAEEYTPKTIKTLIGAMKTIWTWGQARKCVNESNWPFRGLVLPPAETKKKTYYFTPEEMMDIIDAAPARYKLMFEIMARTGMRPGELAGIRVANCHYRRIFVENTVYKGDHNYTPKTTTSKRWYVISAELSKKIYDYNQEYGDNQYGLLFLGKNTQRPLSMLFLRREILNPILEELGIAARIRDAGIRGGIYAFRHGFITEMRKKGIQLRSLQEMVGHTPDSKATDGYTHLEGVATDEELLISDRIEAMLTRKPKVVSIKEGAAVLDVKRTENIKKIS